MGETLIAKGLPPLLYEYKIEDCVKRTGSCVTYER